MQVFKAQRAFSQNLPISFDVIVTVENRLLDISPLGNVL